MPGLEGVLCMRETCPCASLESGWAELHRCSLPPSLVWNITVHWKLSRVSRRLRHVVYDYRTRSYELG